MRGRIHLEVSSYLFEDGMLVGEEQAERTGCEVVEYTPSRGILI